ncbi:hypothetical protein TCAL_11350 [Tigriopus californicus]|uniref:FAM192A/Fyv6 N-terminal domain-containing protein n=1 Tax=Tigriopus californicus TaxID=6832 RepID=A0A553PG27_TIGCA|nr:PSME3-interacting protein-like [Tigriopus californicus]TRY76632.1 hypothetical protein TCAL_11350 [Tigriopus californicus]|eukprot:TCALIF_11350-PA protein Name:"Similar to Fam192a Protein FAM192A (Mus musculus)" AED:0.00 eAED:0.00 QI:152/1/1/1/1/1/2/300/212
MASGFVSEKVLAEKREERQKEWEKVRKPEDPEIRPEESDAQSVHRTLFDQLESNKNKAQEEWDEKHQLKNQVRGIDDDEAEFLDRVDDLRSQLERKRRLEERKELEEYRQSQIALQEKAEEEKLRLEVVSRPALSSSGANNSSKNSSQKKLLGAMVRKRPKEGPIHSISITSPPGVVDVAEKKAKVGGALAGLGDYSSSSDDDDEENGEDKT